MSNINSFFASCIVFVVLIVVPLCSVWWLFFPLGFIAAFFLEKTAAAILAAFILDSFYFGGTKVVPSLTLFIFAILIVRTLLRDRLRL